MSQTLYRKYRPKNFSEVIGQAHIVRTLSNSVKNNRVGHAYLFTGPRGTGKTSIARILAKTINCEKIKDAVTCEKCPSCQMINSGRSLDIIEVDAASNTGVDNIRELRETVAVASSVLRYKVYIIDEVHMLSPGAFNALLKTLEEPPSHVVFILATTEIHKVPETILSRCQRFDFTRLPIPNIIEKLAIISKMEKVKIEKEALEMIAISAEGGMRDAESILGQIISLEDKNITVKEVEEILGTTGKIVAAETAGFIMEKNSTAAIAKINELLEGGYDLQIFNKSLVNYLRQLMLVKINPELKKYFSFEMTAEQIEKMIELSKISDLSEIISAINLLLEAQSKISSSVLPQLPLEIAIIKATHVFPAAETAGSRKYKVESEEKSKIKNQNEKLQSKIKNLDNPEATLDVSSEPHISEKVSLSKEENNKSGTEQFGNIEIDLVLVKKNWPQLLVEIRPFNHSLSALLTNCQPVKVEKNCLTLATPYDFYKERLDDDKNKLTVEEVFSRILEGKLRVMVVLDKALLPKNEPSAEPKVPSEQTSLLSSALEIMGGKIVEQ